MKYNTTYLDGHVETRIRYKVSTLIETLQRLNPEAVIDESERIGSFTYSNPDGYSELLCLCGLEENGGKGWCFCGCA